MADILTVRFGALIFDFDGVLIDSEADGNRHIARYLTSIGHPISIQEAMTRFMGLAGEDFLQTIGAWIGRVPDAHFHAARRAENVRALEEGVDPIAGAIAFVRALPPELPKAIASSSTTRWITGHLDHIGLRDAFGDHVYSGQEHVTRGKPAPDLYLHAAAQLGVPIERCAILEDSPIGASGAVASGGTVIGLCAGSHCPADHGERLRQIGVQAVAYDFDEVARLLA